MNTTSTLMLLALTAALAACGGGDADQAPDAAPTHAVDQLDDLAANAAPNEAVMPPGGPLEEDELPAAVQMPDAAS